jgi:hypothetical protein
VLISAHRTDSRRLNPILADNPCPPLTLVAVASSVAP